MTNNTKAALVFGVGYFVGYFVGKCVGQSEILGFTNDEFAKAKEDLKRSEASLKEILGQKFTKKESTTTETAEPAKVAE